ncbi:hypothetical protein [Okeania sp. SIO2G5]|nr:hypothetical protein [Okeania sp. SIO2G5]NEP76284.1 hypothetical protein [Okeania sp. SIO2G5]
MRIQSNSSNPSELSPWAKVREVDLHIPSKSRTTKRMNWHSSVEEH